MLTITTDGHGRSRSPQPGGAARDHIAARREPGGDRTPARQPTNVRGYYSRKTPLGEPQATVGVTASMAPSVTWIQKAPVGNWVHGGLALTSLQTLSMAAAPLVSAVLMHVIVAASVAG